MKNTPHDIEVFYLCVQIVYIEIKHTHTCVQFSHNYDYVFSINIFLMSMYGFPKKDMVTTFS